MLESIKNIQDLQIAIQAIVVKDYGDFKRKVVLYLNRYVETKSLTGPQKKVFSEMIDKIQYHPNLDIEKTRSWAVEQLRRAH